jgi:hypothetical protein
MYHISIACRNGLQYALPSLERGGAVFIMDLLRRGGALSSIKNGFKREFISVKPAMDVDETF